MIKELRLKNFILFEDETIEFSSGSNGLIGETGSGKSIVFQALSFLLGERNNKNLIRNGTDFFEIEMTITLENDNVKSKIKNLLEEEYVDELIIFRKLSISGKHQTRINGKLISLKELSEVMNNLIEIHKQNSVDKILNKENYINIVDSFLMEERLHDYRNTYTKFKKLKDKLSKLLEIEDNKEEQLEILNFKINQLKDLDNIMPEEELQNYYKLQKERISNKEKALQIESTISNMYDEFTKIIQLDLDIYTDSLMNQIKEVYYALEDSSFKLTRENQSLLDFDDISQDDIKEQLSTLKRLKRKYNLDQKGLILKKEELENEKQKLENLGSDIVEIESELKIIETKLKKKASKLRSVRKENSKKIEEEVNNDLEILGMEEAHFKISFRETEYNIKGNDEILFEIKTNKGYDYNEISEIASGGEKSRIILILKSVLTGINNVNIILLDEIDQGVSGVTAKKLGNKLKDLAKTNQLIVISHTPQVISTLEQLYEVKKESSGTITKSKVKKLNSTEKEKYLKKIIKI